MEQLMSYRCNIEVKDNIKKAQLKQKQQYDTKYGATSFKVGTKVLKKDF
jgi:hypothetical protein